jgi:hypothetical protein
MDGTADGRRWTPIKAEAIQGFVRDTLKIAEATHHQDFIGVHRRPSAVNSLLV